MKTSGLAILLLLVLSIGVPAAPACAFEYDPISSPRYYRPAGWSLPGTETINFQGEKWLPAESVGGVVSQALIHESPYVVSFPAQEFLFNGTRQRMRAVQVQVGIVRWGIRGRTVAYSYSMNPVVAHRENQKWIIDSMAACIYFANFIDDRGDGIFRALVPGRFTAELIPSWAKRRQD